MKIINLVKSTNKILLSQKKKKKTKNKTKQNLKSNLVINHYHRLVKG